MIFFKLFYILVKACNLFIPDFDSLNETFILELETLLQAIHNAIDNFAEYDRCMRKLGADLPHNLVI